MPKMKLAIFCSATNLSIYEHDKIYKLCCKLADKFDLVYGGAGDNAGLMSVVKRAFLDSGARVFAFPMRQFIGKEGTPLDGEIVEWCDNLGQRITKMENLADAFLILKGGMGTLMELTTIYCDKQSKIMSPKPLIVDNSEGYFDDIHHFLLKNRLRYGIGSMPEKYIVWLDDINANKIFEELDVENFD